MNVLLPILTQERALVFRIIHRDNVEWALRHGLHCRNSNIQDPTYISIGNEELIEKRKSKIITVPPCGTLSDYIPFYFTPSSVMLFNILTGYNGVKKRARSDIVFLVSSFERLRFVGVQFLFTDRHAWSAMALFSPDGGNLGAIPWDNLRAREFRKDPEDPEKMDRYQAETLVYRSLGVDGLLGMACFDEETAGALRRMAQDMNVGIRVEVRPEWYFQ